MKRFVLKAIIFSIIVLSIYALGVSQYKPNLDLRIDWFASIIDKHDRLQQAGNNRLLLVGGSNLAFGINSEKMQEELGLNVVNLGVNVGLGGVFMLSEANSVVKSGDTIVVCFEYELYVGFKDIEMIQHAQLIYPEAKAYYHISLKDRCLEDFKHFQKSFDVENVSSTSEVYNRQNFNPYGDVVARIGAHVILNDGKKWGSMVLDASILQAFHDIAARCKTVGARLYLAYPVYPESFYQLNKSAIEDLELQIKNKLDFIPTISTPEAFVMDDSCFYDTVYHLNGTGREQRTAILIAKLKAALPSSGGR
jgi:hypothetical protein